MIILNILIAYGWGGLSPQTDQKWKFLRDAFNRVGKEVEANAKKSGVEVRVSVQRLRARHGGCVIDVIRDRIRTADVLAFDLGDNNPNVHVELGMALLFHETSRNVFVLREVGQKTASDLAGLLFTEYDRNTKKITDAHGFRAAVRTELLWKLRKQSIILADCDENDTETQKAVKSKVTSRKAKSSKPIKRKSTKTVSGIT